MAKKKVTKAAPRKTAKRQKKLTFVGFQTAQGMLLGIDKNNDVYYWNSLDRAWVPNWDVDGSLKAAIQLQAKQEAEKRAAANAQAPANTGAGEASAATPQNLNRQQRRALKSVAGADASFE